MRHVMKGLFAVAVVTVVGILGISPLAQAPAPATAVTSQDLLAGLKDPGRWLTFSGDYSGQRHSPLTQITPDNVKQLAAQWTFQTDNPGRFETTALVLDGVIYATGANNLAWAIDAKTGRQIWRYRRELPAGVIVCCGRVNRGFGLLGDRLFMTTLDAHLIALERKTGAVVWDVPLADYKGGYSATNAPLVIKDMVITGMTGGEYGVRGFLDAYSAQTGKRMWRFYTIPAPGEPGSETWPKNDSWMTGGAPTWMIGSYDPELNLVYWGTGNAGPQMYGGDRKGDNLYAASIVALDADTGKLRWHYQFTPHDVWDYDATHVPVLADLTIDGQRRKTVMVANRNGFFYVLDRTNGKVLVAKPFVKTTWAKEVDAKGAPIILPNTDPNENGVMICPSVSGGTNFMPPAYNPALELMFVTAREGCMTYYAWKTDYVPGESFRSGAGVNSGESYGALRALDPRTGDKKWEFRYQTQSSGGILSTATGLVFTGDNEGNVMAFDGRTGRNLWHYQTGGAVYSAPNTFMVDGRQYVVIAAGGSLTAFGLPEADSR